MKLKIIAILAGLFLVGSFLIPGGSSVNVKNLYEEAEKAFQEEKYQEAISMYEQALLEGEKWGADTKVIDDDFDSLAKYKIAASYSKMAEQLEDPTMYEKSLEYMPELYEKSTVAKQREGLIFLWGHNYYKMERYEEAEPKFTELLGDYPDSQFAENAYYSLGKLNYELKNYEQSRNAFKMIVEKFPNSDNVDDAQYFIARCFYDEENYDQAHIEFEKVQLVDNEDLLAQSRYYDGLSLLRMGRNQDALTAYQKFIADFPENLFVTPAYFDMGTIYGKLKEYDSATRHYELAIQNTKDEITKGEIQFQIGYNYFDAEDYQSAIAAWEKLMEVYPENLNIPEARFRMGESHYNLKDFEAAIAGYNDVLEQDPESDHIPFVTYKIGESYYGMDEKEQALEWYQRVLDDYPESPVVRDATYSKIWSLNDLERYEEAETVGRAYIEKYKEDPVYDIAAAETQVVLGDIKFDAEDYVAAADEYLRVPVDYKDLPKFDLFKSKSLLQAGLAYYKEAERSNWDMGLLTQGADAFTRLIDQFETNFDKATRDFEFRANYVSSAILNLGLAYTEMKEFDKARAALDIMAKDSPEYGNALFIKSRTYAKEGKIDEATVAYQQMLDDESLSETARSQAAIEMASMLTDEKRYAEAASAYQQIVDDYPDSDYVSTAMYLVGSSHYDMEPKTPENMNKAIGAFKDAMARYPEADTTPWAHLGIVWAYESMKDYGMVFKVAEEIENQYADSNIPDAGKVIDRARRHKVDAMEKLESGVSTDDLVAELRKVVNDPAGQAEGKSSAQLRIGNLLFSEKRYPEAITEYELLLEKFPGEHVGSTYYQIAAAAYWAEDYQKSADAAQKGLAQADLTQDLQTGLNYTLGLAQNKLGNSNESIAALKQAIAVGAGAEKDQTKNLVFAAHKELARVYTAAKQYTGAVEEHKFLSENAPIVDDQTDAYFWLARTYEDNLQDYQNAVTSYEKVISLGTSDELSARSLYYSGVLYSKELNDGEKALAALQDLVTKYSAEEGPDVKMMVTDANLRIPELLVSLGKFGDAVTRAKQVRDATLTGDDAEEKVNAQYQLAYLLGEQASQASDSGSPNPDISREAAVEYVKVYELSKPLQDEQIKALASASLYNAGYLLYGVGQYEDYANSVQYFEDFVNDFPRAENYSAALEYLGFASYEAARLKADLNQFGKTAEYFLRFSREFPKSDDAAMTQFQAGEAYFAVAGGHSGNANDMTDPDEKAKEIALAIAAYRKAASAYRGVVDRFPESESAPEALYVMAASYMYLSELADAAEKQEAIGSMGAAYRELADKYPQSEHAAKAFLSVGNDYYNQASQSSATIEDRARLYSLCLENYRKALQVPGIEAKTRMAVESYISETEGLLARDIYNIGSALVPLPQTDEQLAKAKETAPEAIPYFNEVIEKFPNTDFADLSLVQLGMCYEYLEDWESS
ncbi:tetratricopeptide repeat protein, partial [Candidatus Poribacteria bacterium]